MGVFGLTISVRSASMYIIDFDDTLFDTHAYKRARLEAVQAVGISEDLFWKTYADARVTPDGTFSYTDERHAALLGSHRKDEKAVCEAFAQINDRIHEFVQPDAENFLHRLKATGTSLVLLSLGDEGFQEMKTHRSGLHMFFDRVVMVDRTKKDVVAELMKTNEDPTWFINDKVSETKEIVRLFPAVRAVLKISPKFDRMEYEESGLPFFDTLTEIADYAIN